MEIVIVLAIVAALAAALTPMAFRYLTDSKQTQAQNDANQIAQALSKFYQDTGLPPYKNNISSTKVPAKESGNPDYDCLYGASGNAPASANDPGGTWTGGGSGVACQAASTTRDIVANHLINNTPGGLASKAYVTTGKNAWRGPYLQSIPADPWGNAYLVNIGKADPSLATKKAVWVISAGPNGQIETASDTAASGTVTAAGDDIIARVQ
jgi:type II secretory pathway pseudopilin PulG